MLEPASPFFCDIYPSFDVSSAFITEPRADTFKASEPEVFGLNTLFWSYNTLPSSSVSTTSLTVAPALFIAIPNCAAVSGKR